MFLGDEAYDGGNKRLALSQHKAAADVLRTIPQPRGLLADEQLNLARALEVLGDPKDARNLWILYLNVSDAPSYRTPMIALRDGNGKQFFAFDLADSGSYSLSYPSDSDGGALGWLQAGVRLGRQGHYRDAQADFQQSLNCIAYYPTYPLYAWAGAAYARGDRRAAHDAWLYASTSGYSPPGDMAFNDEANAAAVTMLLGLYSR